MKPRKITTDSSNGRSSCRDESEKEHRHLRGLNPNLQDWWLGFPQRDFPHAHHVTVYNPADPAVYERTLYSLEWINPHPANEIRLVQVRVNPKAGPTLALLAVTALLAED